MNTLCYKCNLLKSNNCFSFRNKTKNIRHNICKECHKLAAKKHYTKNKDKYLKQVAEWSKLNPKLRKAISAKHTSFKRSKNYCECCNNKDFLEFFLNVPDDHVVDHITPLSKGGNHCLKNLQYLTKQEHGRKSSLERWKR